MTHIIDRRGVVQVLGQLVRIFAVAACCSGLLAILPASAAAELGDSSDWERGTVTRTATMTELNGEPATDLSRRATTVTVQQDLSARTVTAIATFAAAPDPVLDAAFAVYIGTHTYSSGCTGELALVSGVATAGVEGGAFIKDGAPLGDQLNVSRTLTGTTLTMTSSPHAWIRNNDWDCAFAMISTRDGNTSYQRFSYVMLTPQDIPVLQVDAGDAMQGAYAGKWTTLRLSLRNHGRINTGPVKLRLSGAGLQLKPKQRMLSAVRSERTRHGINVRAKLKSAKARTLTIRVTSPGARPDTVKVKIVRRPKPRIARSLTGTAWWGSEQSSISDSSGWRNHFIRFVSARRAFIGVPPNGIAPRCVRTTKSCVPYTYDRRTGMVRMQGRRFKVTSEGFTHRVGKETVRFAPLTLPKKGSRLAVDLINQDWSGTCLISCTSTTQRLALTRSGRFVRSRSSIGSWTGLGSTWAIIPPDSKGTWRVIGTGRIELRFAEGSIERHMFAYDRDILGRPDPRGEGLLLGGTYFYPG